MTALSFRKITPLILRVASRHSALSSSRCMMSTLDISGIYPPIATPFNADESIAYDKLEHNLKLWNNIPLRGYVVQGSNGEYSYLTAEERVEVVKWMNDTIPADKLLIAGSGCESTRDTITMTAKMASVGAKAVLVVTPCFYKASMNNEAMLGHYTKVADASPVPVILYSVPGNTGVDLSPEVVIQLAKHPNIIGVKDSGGDIAKLAYMVYKTKCEDFQVLAGSASFLFPAYTVGCVGGVCALANVLGNEVCQIEKLFKDRNFQDACDLQQRLVAPNAAVTKKFGVPGLKQAMEMFGYYGGPTRSPLQPLNNEQKDAVRTAFKSCGFTAN